MLHPHTVQVGATSTGRALRLSLARILAFSAGAIGEPEWPQRNLHTDAAKAREAGLEGIIASGTQSEGLLIGFLIDTFGVDAWYSGGTLQLRFLQPVKVDDVVRPALRWSAVKPEGDAVRLSADCWVARANGDRVIEGTVTCRITAT
jgi:acyl dehydratase